MFSVEEGFAEDVPLWIKGKDSERLSDVELRVQNVLDKIFQPENESATCESGGFPEIDVS
jgi:hypothetical protein